MNEKRKLELLAYAKVCFDNCTNPFAPTHLLKKDVSSEECGDLSQMIAEILDDYGDVYYSGLWAEMIEEAEKRFKETQQ